MTTFSQNITNNQWQLIQSLGENTVYSVQNRDGSDVELIESNTLPLDEDVGLLLNAKKVINISRTSSTEFYARAQGQSGTSIVLNEAV